MYMYMYIYIYIYMYIHVYICVYICYRYVRIQEFTYINKYTQTHPCP